MTRVPDEWPSRGLRALDRTRLTGLLAVCAAADTLRRGASFVKGKRGKGERGGRLGDPVLGSRLRGNDSVPVARRKAPVFPFPLLPFSPHLQACPAFEGAGEGDVVGVFESASHGDAMGDSGDGEIHGGD